MGFDQHNYEERKKEYIPRIISTIKEWQKRKKKISVEPAIILCMCDQESLFYPQATRYEENFYEKWTKKGKLSLKKVKEQNPYLYNPISEITERQHLATSYGLMQIMGVKAREMGFQGCWLEDLLILENGLWWGIQALNWFNDRYISTEKTLSAYNAGRPTKIGDEYAEKVLNKYNEYADIWNSYRV